MVMKGNALIAGGQGDERAGEHVSLLLQRDKRAEEQREKHETRLAEMEIAPDVNDHEQARHEINQQVLPSPFARGEPRRQDDARQPRGRGYENERDDDSGLA